jgi:hypothetical protein
MKRLQIIVHFKVLIKNQIWNLILGPFILICFYSKIWGNYELNEISGFDYLRKY